MESPPRKELPHTPASPSPKVLPALLILAALGVALVLFSNPPGESKFSAAAPSLPPGTSVPSAPPVGVESMQTLLLARPDIRVAPTIPAALLEVRILSVQPADNSEFLYRIAYAGLEKGTYNLTDYLETPDGSRLRSPIVSVQVESFLPEGAVHAISLPAAVSLPSPFPYFLVFFGLCSLWAAAGVKALWTARQAASSKPAPARVQTPQSPPNDLAELLLPLVEKAALKSIVPEEKTQLENTLFQFWAVQLGLDYLKPEERHRRILEHKDAGRLLHRVEEWLYQPAVKVSPKEIASLLLPFRTLPLSSLHEKIPDLDFDHSPKPRVPKPPRREAEDFEEESEEDDGEEHTKTKPRMIS